MEEEEEEAAAEPTAIIITIITKGNLVFIVVILLSPKARVGKLDHMRHIQVSYWFSNNPMIHCMTPTNQKGFPAYSYHLGIFLRL